QSGCFLKPRPAEELYDVEADPFELKNLAADQAQARTLQEMRAILARWQRETDDREPPGRQRDLFDRDTGNLLPGVTLPH
ncbi:MAG TPA: heparan N-sulfatase, partial [Candidatus Polarisedimenticolia bacterium]